MNDLHPPHTHRKQQSAATPGCISFQKHDMESSCGGHLGLSQMPLSSVYVCRGVPSAG